MRWARGKGKDREEDRELGRGWPIEAGWYRDREAGWYSGLDSETGWESDRTGKSSLSGLMESMPPIQETNIWRMYTVFGTTGVKVYIYGLVNCCVVDNLEFLSSNFYAVQHTLLQNIFILKGQSREIFYIQFFHNLNLPGPLATGLNTKNIYV